ncbi:MAG: hypothetical protein DMG08_29415 [Acidobacteria bacterium]|nr:MAG: hypothetical protein DMG08_29415 [Acidobacteriota bacterium]
MKICKGKHELVSFIGLILLLVFVAAPSAQAATVANLRVTNASVGSVSLAWDQWTGAGAGNYNLYWGTSSGTYPGYANVSPVTTTSYTVTGLTPGVTYYFMITYETYTVGESAYSNEVSKTVPTATCTYSISPVSQSAGSGGGAGSVTVTAPAGCAWTATSSAGWITITSGSSGSGNGTANYSVQANTGTSSRTGTLTVAGQTATITQGGAAATASADVTLSWDRNAESTIVGYKLYYGAASGSYQTSASCGNTTTYTVTGLGAGTYYFAVTASDSAGRFLLSASPPRAQAEPGAWR